MLTKLPVFSPAHRLECIKYFTASATLWEGSGVPDRGQQTKGARQPRRWAHLPPEAEQPVLTHLSPTGRTPMVLPD